MDLLKRMFEGKDIQEVDKEKEDKELCDFVKNKIDEIRNSATRIAHEKIWYENTAYFYGYDGVAFDYNLKAFQAVNRASSYLRKNRMHVNKILPTLQNRLSRLIQSPPKFDVRPNGNSEDDKNSARFKLDVLTCLLDKLEFQQRRIELITQVQVFGHAYLSIHWDDSLGEVMMNPETGEYAFEGDVRIDIKSPLEVFPDPLAKSFSQARYFIVATVRPLSYFVDHYENGDKVKEEDVWLTSAQYDQKVNNMSNRSMSSGSMAAQTKNCAIELCYYEKPSKAYPLGRMIITANGVKLNDGPLPAGHIPLVKYDDIVSPKYYSEAITTHLRPIQDQYNQVVARRADWVRKMLAGKFVSARGTEVIREALTDENGEWIEYTPVPNAPNGGEPKQLDIPNIPSYAYEEERSLDSQFAEVSGISEVSKGQMPSAQMPAIGMQLLQEQDQTRIGIMTTQHELATAKAGKLILDLVQVGYTKKRKLKMGSSNGVYNVVDVDSNSLAGTNDVIVIQGSMSPQSKSLRRQEIANMYDRGWLGNPTDPTVIQNVVRMMEFGDIAEPYKKSALDAKQAKEFIDMIKEGVMPEITDFDNCAFIAQQVNEFRLSDDGKELMLDPMKKDLLFAVMEGLVQSVGKMTGAMQENIPPELNQKFSQEAEMEAINAPESAAAQLGEQIQNTQPQGQIQ